MESLSLFGLKPYSEEFTEMLMVGAAVTEAVTETTNEAVDDSSDEGESSLEEDGSSDGQSQHSFSESDHYLMPIEVEAQLRLLWMHHQEMLDFIWLRATGLHRGSSGSGDTKRGSSSSEGSGDGWRMFFTRVVLVPPSRFRPPGKVGDMIAEHPQNTHLKKVLVADAAIRAIYSPDTQQQDPTADQPHPQQAPDSSASASAPIDLSKVVSKWIELQNAVNCYMDSSKDSNILAAKSQVGPAGIRQILERKEGLFRKHMMGKRVNFCCRSVISPDPYIGTNEIGVPVHFAMSLHYPTPVNSWNVKYLRGLVRRGPFQYPGTLLHSAAVCHPPAQRCSSVMIDSCTTLYRVDDTSITFGHQPRCLRTAALSCCLVGTHSMCVLLLSAVGYELLLLCVWCVCVNVCWRRRRRRGEGFSMMSRNIHMRKYSKATSATS